MDTRPRGDPTHETPGVGVEVIGTALAGTVVAPIADVLLDLVALASRLAWLALSLLLTLRWAMPTAPARLALVAEREEDAFVPSRAA